MENSQASIAELNKILSNSKRVRILSLYLVEASESVHQEGE